MKPIRLSLAVAVAALGLQACDVSVKPEAASTTTIPADTQQAQQPAAPVDSTPTPVQSTEAPATTPGAAADPTAAAQAPGAPETTAMGAQPAAAPAVPDGVAAPTELAQFLEQNAIKPKAQ